MNTNTKNLSVKRTVNVAIQSGSIPNGSSSHGKFPINMSNVAVDSPNSLLGPATYHVYPVNFLSESYVIGATGNLFKKIKSGDPIVLKRGNVKQFYVVKNNFYDSISDQNTISIFTDRDNVQPLDVFVGASGYPSVASDTFLILNPELEDPNSKNELLKNFSYKIIPDSTTFSLRTEWTVDPSVKVTRLRWRSVPRNSNESTLSFNVNTVGYYTQDPIISVVSSSGRGAIVALGASGATSCTVVQQGGGYLSPPTVVVDPTYVIGPTAEAKISSSLSLQNSGKVDFIRVLNGGSGYTGASVSVSTSPHGIAFTAIAEAVIENGVITNIDLLYGGLGYTAASVTISPAGLSGGGAAASPNVDLYSEWVYEDPQTVEKTKTISGFKPNIPYEIQILVSDDEYFKGSARYSSSYTFQYYKESFKRFTGL